MVNEYLKSFYINHSLHSLLKEATQQHDLIFIEDSGSSLLNISHSAIRTQHQTVLSDLQAQTT